MARQNGEGVRVPASEKESQAQRNNQERKSGGHWPQLAWPLLTVCLAQSVHLSEPDSPSVKSIYP